VTERGSSRLLRITGRCRHPAAEREALPAVSSALPMQALTNYPVRRLVTSPGCGRERETSMNNTSLHEAIICGFLEQQRPPTVREVTGRAC